MDNELNFERNRLLRRIDKTLESPMIFLGKDAEKLKDESEMGKLRKEIAELSLLVRKQNDSR